MKAIDVIVQLLDEEESSALRRKFAIGDAIANYRKESGCKKLWQACVEVSEEVRRIRGKEPSVSYLYTAHSWAAAWKAEEREAIISNRWSVTYVDWLTHRAASRRGELLQETVEGTRQPIVPRGAANRRVDRIQDLEQSVTVKLRTDKGELNEEGAVVGMCSILSRFPDDKRPAMIRLVEQRVCRNGR